MKKGTSLILLSGGLDSATAAAVAVRERRECYAMTFSYGQKHSVEIGFARRLAESFKIEKHVVVDIPASIFASSALSSQSPETVPKGRNIDDHRIIPPTYVPARNILFLSYALVYAESFAINAIYIGVNAIDYSGYPDCRPEFIAAFQRVANLGTKSGVEGAPVAIQAPLVNLKKSDIIRLGVSLGVDYSLTHSCYDPDDEGLSCGACDSCRLRKQGFKEAGVPDPTRYRKRC